MMVAGVELPMLVKRPAWRLPRRPRHDVTFARIQFTESQDGSGPVALGPFALIANIVVGVASSLRPRVRVT